MHTLVLVVYVYYLTLMQSVTICTNIKVLVVHYAKDKRVCAMHTANLKRMGVEHLSGKRMRP